MAIGSWRITNYIDSEQNKTALFAGYVFNFNSNGTVTATNGTNTYNGTWSVTDSNSNDDSISDLDFNLAFSQPASFADLSDDWDIQSQTANKIQLMDISGGNGGVDMLTFEKN